MFPLGAIPYVVVALMGLAAVGAAGWKGYQFGRDSRADEVAELRMAINSSREEAARAEERATGIAERVRVEYRDRIKTIQAKAPPPEIIERVRVETLDCPVVPPSYVSLWNDTPTGSAPAESGPGMAYTWEGLAEATAEAKQRFEENRAKLDALQQLIREQ